MKHVVSWLAVGLILAACSPPGTVNVGALRMSVKWPEAGFQLKAIPPETQSLTIQISGQGLPQSVEHSLSRSAGEQQTFELALPLGSKQVRVRALSATNLLLAEAVDSIEVRPGQTSRLELALTPIIQIRPSPPPGGSGVPATPTGSGSDGGNATTPPGEATSGPDQPDSTAAPAPNQQPSGVLTGSGSTGSSGGSSGGTPAPAPTLTDLTANPQTVTGLSYPSELTAVINDPGNVLLPQHFSWSCVDTGGSVPCNNFNATDLKNRVVWQAPAVPSGPYLLRVEINDGVNPLLSKTVTITVQSGSGTINGGGGFDGPTYGGGV